MITLNVYGRPAPQGSKRHVGRGILIESSKKVTPWRKAIVNEATRRRVANTGIAEACAVEVIFYFSRPISHHNARGELKPSAPSHPTSRSVGDLDKVVRSTLDGLVEAAVLNDDSLVTDLVARKRYASLAQPPGAVIHIRTLGETNDARIRNIQ